MECYEETLQFRFKDMLKIKNSSTEVKKYEPDRPNLNVSSRDEMSL